jgi:hypothetical protein
MKNTNMPAPPCNIELKLAQEVFIGRGLASREAAKQSGEYFSSEEVLQELDGILASAIKNSVG